MRLIDADKLKEHLSDYALACAPMFLDESTEAYNAINDCINAIDEQPTIKTKIVKIDGRLKVGLTRVKNEQEGE